MAKEDDLRADLDALREDLQSLKSDMQSLSGDAVREGRERLHHARDQAEDSAEAAANAVSDCVRERPITCLVTAAAAGLILGKLLDAKSG